MERTDLQKQVHDKLFQMIANVGNLVRVHLFSQQYQDTNSARPTTTHIEKSPDYVELILVEPNNDEDYSYWLQVIEEAEKTAEVIIKQHEWELTNPDFFKALRQELIFKSKLKL